MAPKDATICVDNVDVALLRRRRDWLLTSPESEERDGLVNLLDAMLDDAEGCAAAGSAPPSVSSDANYFDSRWSAAINLSLADRETDVRVAAMSHELWDRFIGPMLDHIQSEEEAQ